MWTGIHVLYLEIPPLFVLQYVANTNEYPDVVSCLKNACLKAFRFEVTLLIVKKSCCTLLKINRSFTKTSLLSIFSVSIIISMSQSFLIVRKCLFEIPVLRVIRIYIYIYIYIDIYVFFYFGKHSHILPFFCFGFKLLIPLTFCYGLTACACAICEKVDVYTDYFANYCIAQQWADYQLI